MRRCDVPVFPHPAPPTTQGLDATPKDTFLVVLGDPVGDDHRANGVARAAAPRFLDVVPVAFGNADPSVHHTVPLQFTPWSYAPYRGG